ncbi:hypothetical protein [Streptomyces sp. NPDC057438]|uniref:hypothetical protein n=1 Tax=Streptomyces sp. NPDC057438 TaxID=3346133 RepID=UPI0036A967F5
MTDALSSESFYQGAKKAAHKAMDDHGRPEYDEFALHAGVSVEKLAKAALAAKNPVYVAEIRNNSADMVMHLGGHVQLNEEKVRTVGAMEAIKRLRKIGVLKPDTDLDLLIEMRNGAAHAAPDSTLAKGMISPLARTIETLLDDLGKPLIDFWERWTEAVEAAVNEQEDQVFRDVQLRIIQARHAFADRFENLPPGAKERALTMPQSHVVDSAEFQMGVPVLKTSGGECPACGARAVLIFTPTHTTSTHAHYSPNGFDCSLCTFKVWGQDEMVALRRADPPRTAVPVLFSHPRELTPAEALRQTAWL